MKNSTLIEIIAVIAIFLIIILISFGVGLLITYLICLVAQGLFNYNLFDKFWYVFIAYYLFMIVFRGFFSFKFGN